MGSESAVSVKSESRLLASESSSSSPKLLVWVREEEFGDEWSLSVISAWSRSEAPIRPLGRIPPEGFGRLLEG